MKVIENLNQESKELLENYKELVEQKKQIEEAIELLKPVILDKFNEPILDSKNMIKYSFSKSTAIKKTLNMNRLLQFVSQEDLDSCYDTKEYETTRITIGALKD